MKIRWPWRRRRTNANGASVQAFVGAEAPIRSAVDDLLRRGPYVDRITDVLTTANVPEGRVFAIRSAWGNGKSSLKNLVIEKLETRDGDALWLDFNPWQWGGGDILAQALFNQMASVLSGDFSAEAQARARLLRRYGSVLTGAGGVLKGAADDKTGLAAVIPGLVLGLAGVGLQMPSLPLTTFVSWALIIGGGARLAGAALNAVGKDRSDESLGAIREDLERRLAQLPGPLIVFVDDIDRLDRKQIRLLIRQVKVNANLPNVVFVLLFQPSIVIRALDKVSNGAGADYLEKIVQQNFDLPAVPADKIFQLFVTSLGPVLNDLAQPENGFSEVRWGNMLVGGVRSYVRNLRDARRLLSSIAIHLPLHRGARAFEVNLIDFVALEALRVFDPDLHTAIGNNKALFVQATRFEGDGAKQADRAAIEAILASVPEARREAASSLVKELFPTVSWALGGSSYGTDWIKGWITEKRVCTAQMFSRYFELQIPEGAVSDSLLALFFENARSPEDLAAQVSELDTEGLLPALVGRLDESVDQIPLDRIVTILPTLFDIGARLKAGSDEPFNGPYISTWRTALWYLRRLPEAADRSRVMLDALARSDALAVPALMISIDVDAREKTETDKPPIFDDDGLDPLKEAWVVKMRALATEPDLLLSHGDLVSLLYRWRDFEGSFDGPRGWVTAVAAQPGALPRLIENVVNIGRSRTMGDAVETRTERFERRVIEDFFDLDTLPTTLSSLDPSALTVDQVRLVELLRKTIGKWRASPQTGEPSTIHSDEWYDDEP